MVLRDVAPPLLEAAAGLLVGLESQVPGIYQRNLPPLRTHYGFSEHEVEFFAIHIEADEVHGERGYQIVERACPTAELQARALERVRQATEMRWQYMTGLYRAYVLKYTPCRKASGAMLRERSNGGASGGGAGPPRSDQAGRAQGGEQRVRLGVDVAAAVGMVHEVGAVAVQVRRRAPDPLEVLRQGRPGVHARAVGAAHARRQRGKVGLEQHHGAGPAQDVAVPLVAHGAAAERHDGPPHPGQALADAVLHLPECEPALLVHEVVEAPAQLAVHLAVEVVERPAQPRGEPRAQRALAAADQAGQVDVQARPASSRAAWISSGNA